MRLNQLNPIKVFNAIVNQDVQNQYMTRNTNLHNLQCFIFISCSVNRRYFDKRYQICIKIYENQIALKKLN